jgi:hypothetical protein
VRQCRACKYRLRVGCSIRATASPPRLGTENRIDSGDTSSEPSPRSDRPDFHSLQMQQISVFLKFRAFRFCELGQAIEEML